MPYIYGKLNDIFDHKINYKSSFLIKTEKKKVLTTRILICRFQTSKSGRLLLHTDIRMLISRRTDCDTAAAHAKGTLESPNELKVVTVVPEHPKFSSRLDNKV